MKKYLAAFLVLMALAIGGFFDGHRAAGAPDTQPPTQPTNFHQTASNATSIDVAWNASTDNRGVTGYYKWRDGTFIAQDTDLTLTHHFEPAGWTCGQTHQLQVAAYDAAGNVSTRATITGTTAPCPDTTPPSAVVNLRILSFDKTNVTVRWDAATDNVATTGYEAKLSTSSTWADVGTALQRSWAGLTCGTQYGFNARAYDAAGNRGPITTIFQTTQACNLPPTAPTNLHQTASTEDSVDVAWNAATDDGGVIGYYKERDGFRVSDVDADLSHHFQPSGLWACGETHTITVIAYDAQGVEGPAATVQGHTADCPVVVRSQIMWGARVDCNGFIPTFCSGSAPFQMQPLNVFEDATHMNKSIDYLQWGVGCFANDADGQFTAADATVARGAIPHMEMALQKCPTGQGLGSWTLAGIAAGNADAQITAWANKIAAFGHPLMIRMWWEPNGPWSTGIYDHPEDYAAAWHHVVSIVRPIAPNATFLYVINGFNTALNTNAVDPTPWKINPADTDWVGMDTYRQYPISNIADPAYDWLRANYPCKPIYWEAGYNHSDPDQPAHMLHLLDYVENRYLDVDLFNFFHRDDAAAGDNLTQASFDAIRPVLSKSFYRSGIPIGPNGTKVQPLEQTCGL